jgi:hypothetical protein
VRLVGRPDATPPKPPESPDPLRLNEEHQRPDAPASPDPFQLGSIVDEGTDLSLTDLPPGAEDSWSDMRTRVDDTAATLVAEGEDWMGESSPRRRPALWLLPLGAALLVLALVLTLGGPSDELTRDLMPRTRLASQPDEAISDAPGVLVISSQPWAYVSVDGVMREWVTPTRLDLAPGPHTIGLFHPASGWRTEREVQIKPGEELRMSVSR